jgi:CubicO group peptidase (beta-lactamase class C family)
MRPSSFLSVILLLCLWANSHAQQLYFPPLSASATWETTTPESLGWCAGKQLDSLYDFLETNNTKAFLVLKDGKIVLEKYFDTFTKDSNWYWASAGKSLTAFLIGKAQEEGSLSIQDTSSKYLGTGWTSCTLAQENKITVRNQITMTTGLDDGVADNHCTADSCLIYKADAGTRWAYHNAPYTLLDGVISAATGQTINAYTQSKIKPRIGMNGTWLKIDNDNVYFSTPRSMARYALLAQNNFTWNTDTLLTDPQYKHDMVNTSQSLNLSYGYLWWLNGKASYMVPTSQIVIPGSYAPHAPSDMFAAIGKNGQIASISKSNGLIMIRMGDAPGSAIEVPTQFCDKIWENLNKVINCSNSTALGKQHVPDCDFNIYPNPATSSLTIDIHVAFKARISTIIGTVVMEMENNRILDISILPSGTYFITVLTDNGISTRKFVKVN